MSVRNNYVKDQLSYYKETSDIDTLYHHLDMKSDDRKEFLLAMINEVPDQINNRNFSLIRTEKTPEGGALLPGVF